MEKANIIRSETLLDNDNIGNIDSILNQAIEDFVTNDEVIINIESKTVGTGLSRFWIYTLPKRWQNER